jgi:hypothetical protein
LTLKEAAVDTADVASETTRQAEIAGTRQPAVCTADVPRLLQGTEPTGFGEAEVGAVNSQKCSVSSSASTKGRLKREADDKATSDSLSNEIRIKGDVKETTI